MKYSIGMTNTKSPSKRRVSAQPKSMGTFSLKSLDTHKRMKSFASKFSGKKNKDMNKKGKKKKGEKKPMSLKKKKILYIAGGVLFFLFTGTVLGVGIYLKNLQESLPSPEELIDRASDESTQILDRNGEVLYTIYADQNREWVSIDDIPEYTKWALLAAEDIEFYQHKGIDYAGIAMAAIQNFTHGEIVRGASTITQQLVKTTILYDILGDEAYAETYSRKIKEVLITMQVENTFTKDEILQMYMNEVALGGVNYGFQAASKSYFGKDVQDLDLAESAMLAGIIASPGYYSPLYGIAPELAKDRQTYVLNQMLKYKELTGVTEEEVNAAKEEELVYASVEIDIEAPHFVFYVKQKLEEQFGSERVETGGLKVTTTLDMSVQEIAEEELVSLIANKGINYNVHNGAVVIMDPNNGEILSMVGSVDYWDTDDPKVDGNVNVAISVRQMGSSMKPYAYLTAFLKGYGPWLESPDISTMKFGNWDLENWDNKYSGLMTARRALVNSRNVSAAYVMQLIGIDSFIDTAEKLGVTTLSDKADYGLSLVLGSGEISLLEHVSAYSVFANEGVKNDITSILKVEDSNGEVLYEKEESDGTRVFDEQEIYALNWSLCDLGGFRDRPFASSYVIGGKNICGKTGTTNGPTDLVALLYQPNLVVGVWAGNNDNTEMPGSWATTIPLPIANAIMTRLADTYEIGQYTRPSGIYSTTVCTDTGAVPGDDTECKKEKTIYIKGNAPQDDPREVVQICSGEDFIPSNLSLAEKYGLVTEKTVLEFNLENSLQQSAYEKYLTTSKDYKYLVEMPGTDVCDLPLGKDNAPVIEMTSPASGSSVAAGSTIDITGNFRVLNSVSSVTTYFDTTVISSDYNADNTFNNSYTIPSSTALGTHKVKVTVVDSDGKSTTSSVSITVTTSTSVSLSISSPVDGASVSIPFDIAMNVTGTPDSVSVHINKADDSYADTLSDIDGTDGWAVSWTDNTEVTAGSYFLQAVAVKGSSTYVSDTITISISL